MMRAGDLPAFYGILLGHEYRKIVREGYILELKPRVVRQRVFNDADTHGTQHRKESLRIADGGDRVHRLAGKLAQWLDRAVLHGNGAGCQQSHMQRPVALHLAAIDHDGIPLMLPEEARPLNADDPLLES